MLTWEEAEERYGPLLTLNQTKDYAKLAHKTIHTLVENGALDGCYLRVGIDVAVEDPQRQSRLKYVFILRKIDEFKNRYKSLAEISRETNVPEHVLWGWGTKYGLWKPIDGMSKRWDAEEVKAKLLPLEVKIEELLNDEQKALIDAFITHRKKGRPIKFHGQSFKTGFPNETREEDIRLKLVRFFYRIICGRSGIHGFGEIVGRRYRPLSKEEMAKFNPDLFDLRTFCRTDLNYMEDGLNEISAFQMCKELTPFLYWYLKEEESRPENDEQYTPEFQAMVNRFMRAIDSFPDKQPRPDESRDKVFLNRDQVVKIYHEILKSNIRDPLVAALQFMIGCLLGLRPPSEYSKIRIEYFELDRHGFLKSDQDGYGRLKLPSHASKGGYSRSHKRYGTLVVPLLVVLINRYLSRLYGECPETRGKGYLFRSEPEDIDVRYINPKCLETWVPCVRGLTQITPDVERIIAYDTRHTINNMIVGTILTDPALIKDQERAAELQVRHNIDEETGERKFGSTGNVHYRKDIAENVYRRIINETLNFPWDLDKLKRWEIERGYQSVAETTVQTVQSSFPSVNPSSPLPEVVELTDEQRTAAELLKKYRDEYAKLSKGRPKKMAPMEWSQRLDWLLEQINHHEAAAARKF